MLDCPWGADEVSRSSWQLSTAISDEGDGLTLVSNSHKVMTAHIVILPSNCCC
jgi:hypothetical protein